MSILVFDVCGLDYLCVITRLGTYGTAHTGIKSREVENIQRNIWLCASLIKKDNFDLDGIIELKKG